MLGRSRFGQDGARGRGGIRASSSWRWRLTGPERDAVVEQCAVDEGDQEGRARGRR